MLRRTCKFRMLITFPSSSLSSKGIGTITGHCFCGEYYARFVSSESASCPFGDSLQTRAHVSYGLSTLYNAHGHLAMHYDVFRSSSRVSHVFDMTRNNKRRHPSCQIPLNCLAWNVTPSGNRLVQEWLRLSEIVWEISSEIGWHCRC